MLYTAPVPDYATEVYHTTKSRYGSWSSPVRVTTTAYQEIAEQILVDQNNRLHIAWRIDGFEANDIYYAYRDPVQTAGESILSQRLQIPADMEHPTLGLNYWLSGATPENSNAFSVELSEGITST